MPGRHYHGMAPKDGMITSWGDHGIAAIVKCFQYSWCVVRLLLLTLYLIKCDSI